MLRSFQVGNHRSIREEQELVLIPAYEGTTPVVPVAAIFGANATGKSNLVDALRFMQEVVRSSFRLWEAERGVPRRPFRLGSRMLAESSTFAVDIHVADTEYLYGFAVNDTRVVEEWLYSYGHSHRKTVIFERSGLDVTLGDSLRERVSRRKLLTTALRDNALLLSTAMQVGEQPEFVPAYRWFARQLRFASSTPGPFERRGRTARVATALRTYPEYAALVRAADVDLADIRVEVAEEPSPTQSTEWIDREAGQQDQPAEPDAVGEPTESSEASHSQARPRARLVFVQGTDGTRMTSREQSAGTLAYIDLLSRVLDTLAEGATLVVDEIDTSLHPRLVARLIELFHDPVANPRTAQIGRAHV